MSYGQGGDGFGRLASMLRDGQQRRPRHQSQNMMMRAPEPVGGGGGMPAMGGGQAAGGGMGAMGALASGLGETLRNPAVRDYMAQLMGGGGNPNGRGFMEMLGGAGPDLGARMAFKGGDAMTSYGQPATGMNSMTGLQTYGLGATPTGGLY